MLVNKTNGFLNRQDTLKSRYECRLMEMEDRLSLETKKCAEVVKARVAPLQDKINKMKKVEQELRLDDAEIKSKVRELTNQVKLKEEQVEFFKKEAGRRKTEYQELNAKHTD